MERVREIFPDVPSLLADIRRRPGCHMARKSVYALWYQLMGISFAEDFHNIPEASRFGGFDFGAFEAWAEQTYNPQRLTLRSFSLAAHLAGSDADGFDLWFRWYDEFLDSRRV